MMHIEWERESHEDYTCCVVNGILVATSLTLVYLWSVLASNSYSGVCMCGEQM